MTGAANVYGEALYDLARAEGLTDELLQQLSALQKIFDAEPDFLRLLTAPGISKQERCTVLDDCLRGKAHPYVLNFLKLLTERGYARQFSACAEAYRNRYNVENGILSVTAITAVALKPAQKTQLTRKLTALTGKTVALTNRIDPEVLGGVRLDYDGKRLDDTVQHRLSALRDVLKNTVL